jgi:predicted RNase H-like HicB family nuclease
MDSIYFPVEVEIDEDGIYTVSCDKFKACHAAGKTVEKHKDQNTFHSTM